MTNRNDTSQRLVPMPGNERGQGTDEGTFQFSLPTISGEVV